MSNKPIAYSGKNYNLNELESQRFEELLHHIFTYRIDDDLKGIFDDAKLMTGVGEEGRDVILQFKGQKKGIIQCKRYKSNIDKPTVAKEIIKFVLYYYKNNSLIDDLSDFTYYFVCSGKFANTSIDLLTNFKKNILNEKNLKTWTEAVIYSKDNKSLNDLNYQIIEKEYKRILANLNIEAKSYSDINIWLGKYPNIANDFFEIKTIGGSLNPDLEKKSRELKAVYYKVAKRHLDTVKFIGHSGSFNRPRNITTTKLYVEPFLVKIEENKDKQKNIEKLNKKEKLYKMYEVFSRSKHYVILGDPGAGKSLMVKHLMLSFIKKNDKRGGLKNYQVHTPFRIELRKYNKDKLKKSTNIMSYLASILEKEYQLRSVDVNTLEYMIENQPTLFFFDGLDEVFDIAQKNAICEDIVNFTSSYKKVKCLVTSRFVGYEEDLFSDDMFETFGIENFNEKQINEFIKRFYTVQISDTYVRKNEIENCKRQLKGVDSNLKSNPLILSLMALLAINNIVIPDSKLEVYRSCTKTLVETRDKDEKGLEFNLRVKSTRGCFGKLGYWQYCSMTDKNQVSKKLAEKTITNYLIEKKEVECILEAGDISQEFLEYAEKRSIYFDDNFMHKTFLEYYTADYIYARLHQGFKISERDKIITKYISNSQWHIIFELLVSMIDEQLVEPEPLDDLIETQLSEKENQVETNYFFLSILSKIKNISDEVRKKIICNSIMFCFEDDKSKKSDFFMLIEENARDTHFQPLIQEVLYNMEKNINENMLIKFYNFVYELNSEILDIQGLKGYKFIILNEKKVKKLKNTNLNLFNNYYLSDKRNINKEKLIAYLKNFGLESIFKMVDLLYGTGIWVDFFSIYLKNFNFSSIEIIEKELAYLEVHGLTLKIIKEFYNPIFFDAIFGEENNLEHIIELYIRSENNQVNEFIEILFRGLNKRVLKEIDNKFKDNLKYQKLVNQKKVSKEI